MKPISKIPFVFFSILLILLSCTPKKSHYFNEIIKSNKGIIRGVEIGESIDEVKLNENSKFLVDDMDNYLNYDYDLDMGNSYTVTYDFSENSLYSVELSIYLEQIQKAKDLKKEFANYFETKYGKSKTEQDGYTIWNKTNKNIDNNIEIALKEDSQSYGYLSITIRNLDY